VRRIFYGWYVAVACSIGLACGLTSVLTGTFSIFLRPLLAEFGWMPSQPFTGLLLATLTATIASPFIGVLIDRIGAKRMILICFLLEGAVLASFATQTESLPMLYGRYVVLTLVSLGTTHVSFARVISLWFDRRRGLALGIALAGLGVGGMVWPLLAQWAITSYGWRTAYLIVAAVVTAIGFLSIALVVRESPAVMGLLPDGDGQRSAPTPASPVIPVQASGFTLAETMRQANFWLMLAAFLLIGMGIQSLYLHLVPIMVMRNVDPMRAAQAQSMMAAALIVGRLAAGMLMDRFFAPWVASAFLVGPIVAVALLAAGASGTGAFVAGALTGLASGAEVNASAFLAGRYFGVRYFSRIYAWFFSAYSIGAGFGPLLTARAVEQSGGYSEILYVLGGLLVLAMLLLLVLKPYPKAFPQQQARL
jgi:MFS family permease